MPSNFLPRRVQGSQREFGGGDPNLANIERSLLALNSASQQRTRGGQNTNSSASSPLPSPPRGTPPQRNERGRMMLAETAIMSDLLSNLQDLCTLLCIGGDAHLRSLDMTMHVQLLMQCFRADGAGVEIRILSLRALALLAEGAPRGVSSIIQNGGIAMLLDVMRDALTELIASDQLTEELLKCLRALAMDAHRKLIAMGAIGLLLRLANALHDHIARLLAYTCLSDLLSVTTPDDWADLEEPLRELLVVLDEKIRELKKTLVERNRTRRPETRQQAAQQRSALAAMQREEDIVVRLASSFVHLIDRVCVTEELCTQVFCSSCGNRFIPLALSLLSFSENSGGPRANTGNAQRSGMSKLQAAAITIISAMFVASPRQTLSRLSEHGAWRWLQSLTMSMISSSSNANTMKAMSFGPICEDQLDVLATLNKEPIELPIAIPSPVAAAGAGNGSLASNAAIAAANKSLLAAFLPPTEPLAAEEHHLIVLLELLLFITPHMATCSPLSPMDADTLCGAKTHVTPIHTWQWEDEFHTRNDYEEHVSTALEIEYRAQQITRQYRSVDITAANRSVSASFDKMRHYTLSGMMLRPLYRQPFISHFYHTRGPQFVGCTCYTEVGKTVGTARFVPPSSSPSSPSASPTAVLNDSPWRPRSSSPQRAVGSSSGPLPRAFTQREPERSPKKRSGKSPKGGFFAKLYGCCTSQRNDSPERPTRSEKERSPGDDASDPDELAVPRSDSFFDDEGRSYMNANRFDAAVIATTVLSIATTLATRTVNPALLRHSAVLLLRSLSALKSMCSQNTDADKSSRKSDSPLGRSSPQANSREEEKALLLAKEFLAANRQGIIRAIYILLLCSDYEHSNRLCASTNGLLENADHTHAPRWQGATGGAGEKQMAFTFSLQGEMLLCAVESATIVIELHPPSADDLMKEGVHTILCAGLKTLSTLVDTQSCPQHMPIPFLLEDMTRRMKLCIAAMEGSRCRTVRHSSSSGLLHLLGSSTPHAHSPRSAECDVNVNSLVGIDAGCPVAIASALALLQRMKRHGTLSIGDHLAASLSATVAEQCQLCSIVTNLRGGEMAPVGESSKELNMSFGSMSSHSRRRNSEGQTLLELLSAPAGKAYKESLEELTVRLVTFVGDQVGVAGSSTSDIVSVTRNHKTVTQPSSRVMLCLQQRLSLPISFKLTPLHPRELFLGAEDSAEEGVCSITIGGKTLECEPSLGGIVSINLQAFLFTTVGAVVDDLAAKYTEVVLSAGWSCRCINLPNGELCEHCLQTQSSQTRSRMEGSRRRSSTVAGTTHEEESSSVDRRLDLDVSETQQPHPNRVADDDEHVGRNSSGTRPGTPSHQQAGGASESLPPADHDVPPAMAGNRVVLVVNGYPLTDRSRRLADVIVSFGTCASAFKSLLDPTGCDGEARGALVRALGVWATQHTLQFAFLKEPIPSTLLPPIHSGCTCAVGNCAASGSESCLFGVGPSPLSVPTESAQMRAAIDRYKESICSPWHAYSAQRLRNGHGLVDDVLAVIECLVELVVAPLSPTLLLDAGRKLYSSVIHTIRYQSLSFASPAFSELCHPILRERQIGDSVAEYALWNYPLMYPLALRIAVFKQIMQAKRTIIPRGNLAARNVVGGEWLRHLREGGAAGRAPRSKVKASVERDSILSEGLRVFEALASCPLTLDVEFKGEPGSGLGPTCEFFCLVTQVLMRREHRMWLDVADAEDGGEYVVGRLYPAHRLGEDAPTLFKLLGRVIGRALQDGREVRVPLHEVFLRSILGKASMESEQVQNSSQSEHNFEKALPEVLASIDPQLEHSLSALEKMSESDLDALQMVFTLPGDDTFELLPGGADMPVTAQNVIEYCRAVRYHVCHASLEVPTMCILEGIADSVVPGHLRLFTPAEFNLLLGGQDGKLWNTPEELIRSMQCDHGYTMQSSAVTYFVSTVISLTADQQRLFLKFISGTDCLPIGGLSPPITIVRKGLTADATPFRRRKKNLSGISPLLTLSPSDVSPAHPTVLELPTAGLIGISPPGRSPRDAFLSVGEINGTNGASEGSYSAAAEQSAAHGPLEIPDASNAPPIVATDGFDGEGTSAPSYAVGGEGRAEVLLTTQEQVDECLPTVNTCFHYLKLPDYSSEAVCRDRLLCAITEGQGVFLLS